MLTAAVDASRLGVRSPLPAELLRAAASGYCDVRDQQRASSNWFESALAYATETLHGAAAALEPVGPGMTSTQSAPVGYTVADYLLQHATHERRSQGVPAAAWEALATRTHDSDDLSRLGTSAQNLYLYSYATRLYRRAADAGDRYAASRLADLLAKRGEVDGLRARAEAGDDNAAERLANLLAERGDVEALRARADADDQHAWHAASQLAELLAKRGDLDEALQLLQRYVYADAVDMRADFQVIVR